MLVPDIMRRWLGRLFPSKRMRRHSLVGPPALWAMKRDFQFEFLMRERLRPTHFLLDLGCGTMRGGIPIVRYLESGHYFGIDLREEALREELREINEAGLDRKRPTLILASDLARISLECRFDFVWAVSVLFHISDSILDVALSFVKRHLRMDGVCFANVNVGAGEAGRWREFPVIWRALEDYSRVAARQGLCLDDMGPLQGFGHSTGIKEQDQQRMIRLWHR